MAITTPHYTGLTAALQDPYGGFATGSASYHQQYDIYNLPPRLRGMEIDRTLKTVTYDISESMYYKSGNDPAFKDMVKRDISRMLADEVYKVTKFTQMKDPAMQNTRVFGRVVMMTEDQLKKLIQAAR